MYLMYQKIKVLIRKEGSFHNNVSNMLMMKLAKGVFNVNYLLIQYNAVASY